MSGRKKKKAANTTKPSASTTAATPSPTSANLDTIRASINTYFNDVISLATARRNELLADVDRIASNNTISSHITFNVEPGMIGKDGVIKRLGRVAATPVTTSSTTPVAPSSSVSTVAAAVAPTDNHSHGHGDDHHSHGHSHGHSHSHGGHDDDACHGHAHGGHGGGHDDACHGHSHGHSHGEDNDEHHGHSHGGDDGGHHGHSHGAPMARGPLARMVVIKPVPIYGGRVEVRESKDKGKYWIAKEFIAGGTKLYDESPSLLTVPYPTGYSTPPDIRDALSRCLLQHPSLSSSLYAPVDLTDYPTSSSPDTSIANDEQWRRAAAQLQINGFNVSIGDGTCRCFVYDTMSALNHSCWPNADKIDDVNGPAAVWTIRDIQAGEEICISYSNDMLRQPRAARQSYLSRMWRFTCTCQRCDATADTTVAPSKHNKAIWTQLRVIDALLVAGDNKANDDDRKALDDIAVVSRHMSPDNATAISDSVTSLLARGVFADTHWRIQSLMSTVIDQLPQLHIHRPFALSLLLRMSNASTKTLPRLSTAHMDIIRLADIWHDDLQEAFAFLRPYYDDTWTQKLLDMYSTIGDGKVEDL